jgi:hypothetical protein
VAFGMIAAVAQKYTLHRRSEGASAPLGPHQMQSLVGLQERPPWAFWNSVFFPEVGPCSTVR